MPFYRRLDNLLFPGLLEHQGPWPYAHHFISPYANSFNLQASDLCLVDPEGYVTEDGAQLPINAAGFYIHTAIHKARPDIEAAAHCHSIHARAWSVFGKPIELLTQDSCVFYQNLSVYK
jgi:ribulose-5-phosphate 4-epimerase/fuculose-1-phosphate aldolase